MSDKEIIHDLKVSQILDEEDLKYLWEKKRNFIGAVLETFITQWISFLDSGEGLKNRIDKTMKDGSGKPREEYLNILANIEMFKGKKLALSDIVKVLPINDKQIDEILVSLLNPKYEPPFSPFEIVNQLTALFCFYYDKVPSWLWVHYMLCVDFNLAKLTYQAIMARGIFFDWEKEEEMSFKRQQGKTQKSEEKKQMAIDLFYRIDIDAMSLHKVAKTIEEKLIKMGIFPEPKPGEKKQDRTKQIKRYLMADKAVRNIIKK